MGMVQLGGQARPHPTVPPTCNAIMLSDTTKRDLAQFHHASLGSPVPSTLPTAEAPVCLRDQFIDENNGVVDIVRRARGLRKEDGGVGRGQGIDNASEGSEAMTEASRIEG